MYYDLVFSDEPPHYKLIQEEGQPNLAVPTLYGCPNCDGKRAFWTAIIESLVCVNCGFFEPFDEMWTWFNCNREVLNHELL